MKAYIVNVLCCIALLLLVPSRSHGEEQKTEEMSTESSEEDRGILNDLDVLENLDLLKDLETIKYLPLLTKMVGEDEEQ